LRPKPCKIEEVKPATRKVKILRFYCAEIAREAKPGQFAMVWCPKAGEAPMSIAYAEAPTGKVEFAVADAGPSSHGILQKHPGDYLGLRGPYGTNFTAEVYRICIAGGGYGIAPLYFMAKQARAVNKEVMAVVGAKTSSDLFYLDELEKIGCELHVTTEDGSRGMQGVVTDLLPGMLRQKRVDKVLSCGPELMMSKICEVTSRLKIPTQISVERHMKCGFGICGSCDIGGYLACKDGPVFNQEAIFQKTEFGHYTREASGVMVPLEAH
jgi:dihydroorotate dehydrogenase electron transfer subunit